MKMDYHLESKLTNIATKFEDLVRELLDVDNGNTWNFICSNYNGHPLENIAEFTDDVKRGVYDN